MPCAPPRLRTRGRSGRAWPWVALLGLIAGFLGVFVLHDPRRAFPAFVAANALATAGWLALLHGAEASSLSPRLLRTTLAATLGIYATALLLPPAFSDDVFRYVYEGRVVWVFGPAFPFLNPPADAPRLGVPVELLDAAWLRINHAEIPTIYPPFAQLVFAISGGIADHLGGGHHLLVLKAFLTSAAFGMALVLRRVLLYLGRPEETALLLLACPVLVLETAREGHADTLSALGMAVAILGFSMLRPRAGYAGIALAALGKLNGIVLLPVALRVTRRGLTTGLGLLGLLALPSLLGGRGALAGLTAYASEWQAGDGAFSCLLFLARALLGGDWRRLDGVPILDGLTVTAHQVARGLTFLFFAAGSALLLRRRFAPEDIPERSPLVILLLLLMSPTLHPWYAVWLIPWIPFTRAGRAAILALIVLVPLLHHPGWLELERGAWTEVGWIRAMVHLPVWLLLTRDLVGGRCLGYSGGRG